MLELALACVFAVPISCMLYFHSFFLVYIQQTCPFLQCCKNDDPGSFLLPPLLFFIFFVLSFYSTSPPQLYPQIRSICRFITPAHLPRPNPLAGTFLPQDLTYPSPPLAAPCRRLHRGWRVQPRCRRYMPQSCPPPKPV